MKITFSSIKAFQTDFSSSQQQQKKKKNKKEERSLKR